MVKRSQKMSLKHWFISAIAVLALVMLFAPARNVCAAVVNPLADMPKKSIVIFDGVPRGKGCDYFTPFYTQRIKMTAVSSNENVATVKAYNFKEPNKQYNCGYETTFKGYGTTVITVTAKVGGKTYTNKETLTYKKYENPFSSLKIGSVDYTKKINKLQTATCKKNFSGKLSYKLKKGYKVKSVTATYRTASTYKEKTLKNGQKLPTGTSDIRIALEDSTGIQFYVYLYTERA